MSERLQIKPPYSKATTRGALLEFFIPGLSAVRRKTVNPLKWSIPAQAGFGTYVLLGGGTYVADRSGMLSPFIEKPIFGSNLEFSEELQEILTEEQKEAIRYAHWVFVDSYGAVRPSLKVENFTPATPAGRVENEYFLDGSIPGVLRFNIDGIKKQAQEFNWTTEIELYHEVVMHGEVHAQQTPNYRPIDITSFYTTGLYGWEYGEGVGTHGLRIIYHPKGAPLEARESFDLIEEGVAGALWSQVNDRYLQLVSYSNGDYYGPLELSWNLIKDELMFDFDYHRVAKLIQRNNLMGFVGVIVGKKRPNFDDLIAVASWYEKAYQENFNVNWDEMAMVIRNYRRLNRDRK